MREYKITAEEWFFIRLLFLAQPEEDKPEYLYEYLKDLCKGVPRDMLLRFQEVGIINKSYKVPNKGDKFYPENIEFNKNFLHKYLKYSGDLGEELFTKYPNFITIKGITYSLKNVGKKYNSLEEFFFAYGKAIAFNPAKHEEVMNLLDWANKQNLINTNICEFVISRKWLELQQLKDQGFDGNTVNIDELI